MSILQTTSKSSAKALREEVRKEYAGAVISNDVLNLKLDKVKTLSEWARILKPGGRLYVSDILVKKSIPPEALDDISLWTE